MAIVNAERAAELLNRAETLDVPGKMRFNGKELETGSAVKVSLKDLQEKRYSVFVCTSTTQPGDQQESQVAFAVVHKQDTDHGWTPTLISPYGEVGSSDSGQIHGQAALRRGETMINLGVFSAMATNKAVRFLDEDGRLRKVGLGIAIGVDTGNNLVLAFDDGFGGNSWAEMSVYILPTDNLWKPPFSLSSIHSGSLQHYWGGIAT